MAFFRQGLGPPATVLFLLLAAACSAPEQAVSTSGDVMGTSLSMTVVATSVAPGVVEADLAAALDQVRAVDARMSNWRQDSEISLLNRAGAGRPFHISPQLAGVLRLGLRISRLTNGAFDMTTLPLVERWGFLRQPGAELAFPTEAEIGELHARVGWRYVTVDDGGNVRFSRDGVMLDLGGIAKGFGVDAAFSYLRKKGYRNILVEIGGETRSLGHNPRGRPWRIGIRNPRRGQAESFIAIVDGSRAAVATSGDYENFFFHDGKRYSHVIDPATGWPVRNGVCSATVVADECAYADALATALMVLGVEKGMRLVDGLAGVEALMAVRNTDDTVSLFYSKGMKAKEVSGRQVN